MFNIYIFFYIFPSEESTARNGISEGLILSVLLLVQGMIVPIEY